MAVALKAGFAARQNKFRNVPTVVDNIQFASKREARRYSELKLMERAGLIVALQLQVRYKLDVNKTHICDYVCDYQYINIRSGELVVEDAKGMSTPAFLYKQRLMKAVHGIDVITV